MIIIDCRETALIGYMTVPFTVLPLPLGDIQIGNDEWLLERKTITDLASSIVDGRFIEQRERLRCAPFKNVGYIIEGQPNDTQLNGGLIAALTSLSMEFKMFISDAPNTTCAIVKKICAKKNKMSVNAEHIQANKMNKVKIRTPKVVLELALQHVPGVGQKISKDLASKFDSIAHFVQTFIPSSRKHEEICQLFGSIKK